MEELEDDPSSEMLAIELYRPAVYAARTFDLLYVLRYRGRLAAYVRVLCRFIVPPPTVSNPSTSKYLLVLRYQLVQAGTSWYQLIPASKSMSQRYVK